MIVETIRLHEVDYVESVLLAGSGIRDAEVVPLSVTAGVIVGFEDQVVLVLVDLDGTPQVARLKPRLEE